MNMLNNKIIFGILCVFILSITLISAQQENPSYEINTNVNFTTTCTVNGTTCSSLANCNITIKAPSEIPIIYSKEMTNNDNGLFNISIENDSIDTVGNYNWDLFCCDGSECGEGHGTFQITKTGQRLDSGQGTLVIGAILILILLSCSFIYFSSKIEYTPFKIFLTAMSFLFLMFTTGIGFNLIDNLMLTGSILGSAFGKLYILMLILSSGGMVGLMVYIIYMSVRQFYAYRGLLDKYDD